MRAYIRGTAAALPALPRYKRTSPTCLCAHTSHTLFHAHAAAHRARQTHTHAEHTLSSFSHHLSAGTPTVLLSAEEELLFAQQMQDIVAGREALIKGSLTEAHSQLHRAADILVHQHPMLYIYSLWLLQRVEYLMGQIHRHKQTLTRMIDTMRRLTREEGGGEEKHMDKREQLVDLLFRATVAGMTVSIDGETTTAAAPQAEQQHEAEALIGQLSTSSSQIQARIIMEVFKGLATQRRDNKQTSDLLPALAHYASALSLSEPFLPGQSRFVIGDVLTLIGDAHKQTERDLSTAQTYYTQAISWWKKQSTQQIVTCRGERQVPIIHAYMMAGGQDNHSDAITQIEQQLGPDHPLLSQVLHSAAVDQHLSGDAISAEGLFRSSVRQLQSHLQHRNRLLSDFCLSPSLIACCLVECLFDYAALLRASEWNQRSRSAEADYLIKQISSLGKEYPQAQQKYQRLQKGERGIDTWITQRLISI